MKKCLCLLPDNARTSEHLHGSCCLHDLYTIVFVYFNSLHILKMIILYYFLTGSQYLDLSTYLPFLLLFLHLWPSTGGHFPSARRIPFNISFRTGFSCIEFSQFLFVWKWYYFIIIPEGCFLWVLYFFFPHIAMIIPLSSDSCDFWCEVNCQFNHCSFEGKMSNSPRAAFKICFSFGFKNKCYDVDFFLFILLRLIWLLLPVNSSLLSVWGHFSPYFFKYCICPILPLLYHWDSPKHLLEFITLSVIDWRFVLPQNSYVEILTPICRYQEVGPLGGN